MSHYEDSKPEGRMAVDLNRYKRPGNAAKALHKFLFEWANENGWSYDTRDEPGAPILESPAESETGAWRVVWEEGPYEWGICVSCGEPICSSESEYRLTVSNGHEPEIHHTRSKSFYLEPYFSFDVSFVPC